MSKMFNLSRYVGKCIKKSNFLKNRWRFNIDIINKIFRLKLGNKNLAHFTPIANSNYAIGRAYYDGNWLEKNIPKAMLYFRLAADEGHAKAQLIYGEYCEENKDYVQAFTYYKKAADNGNSFAMYNIGTLCEKNYAVDILKKTIALFNNREEVTKLKELYFVQAANSGHKKACLWVARYYNRMNRWNLIGSF